MNQETYINQILEPVVKPLIQAGWNLEEDNDSGHGIYNNSNRIAMWMRENRASRYANAPHSPDLSIIETCWSAPKSHTRKYPHYDDNALRSLIEEGWKKLTYESVNKMVDSMVERVDAYIATKGQMTQY